jgi:hypothetical protein
MKKMTREEARKIIRSFFPDKGVPFVIEVELTKDLTEDEEVEVAQNLMTSMLAGTEILPGVKVSRVYKQTETLDSLVVRDLNDEAREIEGRVFKALQDLRNSLADLTFACQNKLPEGTTE